MFIFSRLTKVRPVFLFILLFILWATVQVGLFYVFGVKTSTDSVVYISDAERMLDGEFPRGRGIWYVGYSAFLAAVFLVKGGLPGVVLGQVVSSGVAAYCLYTIVKQITGQRGAALLAAFLYIAWIKIHQWNFYIYSESFFTSLCIITFALLLKCKKPWHFALMIFPLAFTFFVRPTGFGFFVGIVCYFFSYLKKVKVRKEVLIGLSVVVVAAGILLLNKMLESYILIESYIRAEIIYPKITLGVEAPADLTVPPAHYPPITRLLLFIMQNPLYFVKISGIKFFLFVSNIKPYFSLFHNLLLVVVLWPLYYFAVRGFRLLPSASRGRYFIAGYILTQTLTVTLTTENWDGRFLVPVLPFVFILSAVGLYNQFGKASTGVLKKKMELF